ncbi:MULTISPECIES: hypothetical protein [unclassified Nocardia]|uniref:DUF7257 domain-containing protein n=1 Tax=unclassified Nocardia TaxID=2637762 RepID=UPI001CE46662|nr:MULTISPECIES: hypothetical protein [unclassified Nocardia]
MNTASQNMNGANANSAAAAQAAASGAGTAQSTASAAQNTAAANAASIALLTPPPPPPSTPGITLSDNFARATLGPNYNPIKSSQVADLIIVNNQVELDPNGSNQSTGSVVALNTTTLQTDNQSLSLVMGAANNSPNSATGIMLRADPRLLTFAYAWIYADKIYIGSGTRSNGVNTYNDWTSSSTTVNTGDTVTFTAVGSNYQVLVNNVPVVGFSDTAGTVPTGPGYRSVGFGCSYNVINNSGYFSFAVAAMTAADQQPAIATGTGWSLVRGSTVGYTQPSGAGTRVTGVFDTVRQANNVTIISLGAGQVQVNRAGWYLITAAFNFSGLDNSMRTELWSTPTPGGNWNMLRAGAIGNSYDSNNGGGSYATSGSFVVYLPQGAVVAPGLSTNTSNSLSGPFTCFDGALLNWL